GSKDEGAAILERPGSVLLVEAGDDSRKDCQISNVIHETFEPCAEGGFTELDARDHAVHLVDETGDEKQHGSPDLASVGPAPEVKRADDRDHQASQRDGIRRNGRMS